VGAHYNPATRRAELQSIGALLGNNTARAAFSHAVAGSLLTAGTFVAAVSAWWLVRSAKAGDSDGPAMYRPAAILGCWVALIAAVGAIAGPRGMWLVNGVGLCVLLLATAAIGAWQRRRTRTHTVRTGA